MSKQKLEQLWSLKKSALKRSRNWKQRLALNPQLSWLTTVYLHGFDRNVPQLIFVFFLHLYLQRAVKNEQKEIFISNYHSLVLRWHLSNFAEVPFQCMLGMPSNSAIKLNFKKRVCKQYWFSGKKVFTSWIRSCYLLYACQLLYPLSYMAVVFNEMLFEFFSTSSPSTRCRMQAGYRINLRWQTWRRRMMGLWC